MNRLAPTGLSLVLIEAGTSARDARNEAACLASENALDPRHPAAHLYRRRMLGGSSTVWGGRCIPLDAADFIAGGGGAGWPVAESEISRYLPAATDFLDCGEPLFDEAAFDRPLWWAREGSDALDLDGIERFSRPTNLWRKTRGDLLARRNVTVLAGHLVVSVDLASDGSAVDALRVVARRTGAASLLRARHVVLACGGIETARLLLASRNVVPNGIGNHSDQLGRHYMTHVIGEVAALDLSPDVDQARIDYRRTRDGIYARSLIRLPAAVRLQEGLPNAVWRPVPPAAWDPAHHSAILSAMHLAKALLPREYHGRLVARDHSLSARLHGCASHLGNILADGPTLARFVPLIAKKRFLAQRKLPSVFLLRADRRYGLEMNAEQLPDRDSRITLGQSRDRWDIPLIRLDWRLGEETLRGIHRNVERLAELLPASGLGRLLWRPERVASNLVSQGGHHIGTTRMSDHPGEGVVDRDCKVFGVSNLHIASASVFPTSGAANPTLLLTCLAIRLADHLTERLMPQVAPPVEASVQPLQPA